MPLSRLPITERIPELLARLRERGVLVLEAPPGAGKTTRVPAAILDAGLAGNGEVVVLQPRRLAARLAARRVAEERGERVGETVGYQVRFEDVAGPRTRLRFVTEGILARRQLSDPTLSGVGCVVLDEFHERHLAGDVALATLRRLRETARPDLEVVVMSATLDAEPVARYLGDAPRVRSEGRAFPVEVEHAAQPDDRPLEVQVAGAVSRLLGQGLAGDVLVFLPGAAEIRRAMDACRAIAQHADLLLVALHGDLPPERQDEAVRPAAKRKVILSTNVAETSVTIDGVVAVVDSGLARIASHSPWSGLPVLRTQKVSRASAAQRAGRAGRTRPGVCVRLYTRSDHDGRPAFETPEIRRLDLAPTVLELRALGEDPATFPWFEAPETAALEAAEDLLRRLHAVDPAGRMTEVGRRMLAFPLHPRLARLIVEAERRNASRLGVLAAALLSERDLRLATRTRGLSGGPGRRGGETDTGPSDVLALADAFEDARRSGGAPERLRARGIDAAAFRAAERALRQIEGIARRSGGGGGGSEEAGLALAILAAYPDRVARRRTKGRPEVLLSGGGAATLAEESVVRDADLLVAVDAEERARGGPLVRLASAIDAEALLETAPERIREATEAVWNAEAEKVEVARRVLYDDLVLEERRGPAAGEEAGTALLRERALAAGPEAFVEAEALARLRARVSTVAAAFPERGIAALSDEDVRAALAALCEGRSSFAEVRDAGLLAAVLGRLAPEQRRFVEAMAPERVALHGGWSPRVEYAAGRPPWIEAFVQDFFGLAKGPSVCGGRVPVVLQLLAPSRRPVQVTTDLEGFWDRHYPATRRELSRRYPRHDWPEDPRTATPPARRGPRRTR